MSMLTLKDPHYYQMIRPKESLLRSYLHTPTHSIKHNSSFKGDTVKEVGVAFDYLESSLKKFEGPFFLREISLELNKIDAYVETKGDPEHVIQLYKKRFRGQ
ncbi:glutathione transferase lambda 1 [Artemisia annua]|uniref:Glutathione transferase lambda 1 n=1 Tax=Artemisia annua TaxID=35608 RepID=A0A2U1LGW0_ARTAN|nr:glutathione transferase lambda 1 [Artemisia annua]